MIVQNNMETTCPTYLENQRFVSLATVPIISNKCLNSLRNPNPLNRDSS